MSITADKKHPLYKQTFQSMFKSLQLSGAYVLFYDLDWSREDVIEYQGVLAKVDEDVKLGTITEKEMMQFVYDTVGINCVKANNLLPYRIKAKMCKIKYKPKMVGTFGIAVDDSAGTHLAYATYILVKYYNFNKDQLMEWYNHLIDFCKLYADGMTDEHVLEYFEKYGEIKITEE